MRINHNISALNAWRQLQQTDNAMTKSLERLSSGLRINRAGDDAAGLAASEKMRAQIRGLNQAIRNAQDGISLIQTAEGALNEAHSILQRMRELTVQAASGTTTASDRAEIQKEINQLIGELDRIANSTEFNTKKLLNGQAGAVVSPQDGVANVQAGEEIEVGGTKYDSANTNVSSDDLNAAVTVTAGVETQAGVYQVEIQKTATAATIAPLQQFDSESNGFIGGTLIINGYSISLAAGDSLSTVVTKINNVAGQTGVQAVKMEDKFGAGSHGLQLETVDVGSSATISVSGTNTLLKDLGLVTDDITTVLSAAGTDAQGTIGGEAAIGVGNTLTGANGLTVRINSLNLDLDGNDTLGTLTFNAAVDVSGRVTLQIGANNSEEQRLDLDIGDMRASALGVNNIDVTDVANARSAVTTIDNAITLVSSERAKLGAYQNRLEHTISNLSVAAENLQAAESRIRDVDMALEMMEFTRYQILLQAGTAMLANANVRPQSVLQLLG